MLLGLGVVLVLISLALAACGTDMGARTTTLDTGVTTTTTTSDVSVTETVMDTGYTTTSTTPASVPALASGITPEQVLQLVASKSQVPATDWELRDSKNLGDWAVAKLYTSRFSEQMDERGVAAVFAKRAGAWYFHGWVSLSDSSVQQTIELRNMDAPDEVWKYFGLEPASSNADQSALPEQMPENFGFTAAFGVGANNLIDTFDGTFTKDIIAAPKPNPTIALRLTRKEMASLYENLVDIGILDYPSDFRPDAQQEAKTGIYRWSEPHLTYVLRVRAAGCDKYIFWEDGSRSTTPQANALRGWFDRLKQMIEAKPEYKAMPPTERGYL